MKLKKALTLLPALLLVVGLGACDEITSSGTTTDTTTDSGNDYGESTGTTDYIEPDEDIPEDAVYTLRIIITYNGTYQTLPSYADIYYSGETNTWGFEKLTPNGSALDLYFDALPAAGTYEYGLIMDYTDETSNLTTWTYKVNSGSGNETFTVLGTEEEGFINEVTVEAKAELGSIIPDPDAGDAVNVTFAFNVTSKTVPSGSDVYFTGGFNGDNWQTWLKCTNTSGTIWEYTFDTLTPGAQIGYKVVYGTTPVNGDWTWCTEITTTDQSVDISLASSNTTIEVTI